jgi:hypothetical protein
MAANLECVDRVVRTIANLDNLEVEEIFQRVAMLPPISSALLQNMRATLSDMYEASRDTSESKEELPRRRSLHLQPKKKTSVTRRSTRTKARAVRETAKNLGRQNDDSDYVASEGESEEEVSDKKEEDCSEPESAPKTQHTPSKVSTSFPALGATPRKLVSICIYDANPNYV